MSRFEREARLASSLQHPHICTIHELGEHEGQPFIPMERLEGKTVRQLHEAGRMPISRVLHLAAQMADALDAALRPLSTGAGDPRRDRTAAARPDEALLALEPAQQTELGTVAGLIPPYLRAEAFLQKAWFADAIREYQKVIRHRVVDPFSTVVPLAHLGLARASARSGEIATSRKAYQELASIGRDGPAEIYRARDLRLERDVAA
ncbi:MAG: hypothetical protein ABIS06_00335 [Vicinamibacterales bacterium]